MEKIQASIYGSLAGIYTYTLMNIYGISNAAFKKSIALSVAGQKIPFFGRVLWSFVAFAVVFGAVYMLSKNKKINLDLSANVLIALTLIAIVLSFVAEFILAK